MVESQARDAFARNLQAIKNAMGINQSALAEKIGVTRQSVSGWLSKKAYPTANQILKIASALNVSEDDLVSSENGYAQRLGNFMHARRMTHGRATYLPVRRLGMVHAGDPTDEPEADSVAMVPEDVALAHPDGFVLRVEGDCMDRLIPDGYDVVVDPTVEPRVGSVVVARSEDTQEVVMRRLAGTARTRVLEACSHGDYEDLVFPQDGGPVSVVGVVVWSQRGFLD